MEELQLLKRQFLSGFKEDERSEAANRFHYLLGEKYKYSTLSFLKGSYFPSEKLSAFKDDLQKLREDQPVQYLVGEVIFDGLIIKVSPAVLIPRIETEEFVDRLLSLQPQANRAIDLATGSGCIALSLARDYQEVYALEKSASALEVARENALLNKLNPHFIEDDILDPEKEWPLNMDVIVSNPPYVRYLEKEEMKANVLNYEPKLALFVDDNDPLIFYRAICEYAKGALNPGGLLAFEINQYLVSEMKELLGAYFKNYWLEKDGANNYRMAFARKE